MPIAIVKPVHRWQSLHSKGSKSTPARSLVLAISPIIAHFHVNTSAALASTIARFCEEAPQEEKVMFCTRSSMCCLCTCSITACSSHKLHRSNWWWIGRSKWNNVTLTINLYATHLKHSLIISISYVQVHVLSLSFVNYCFAIKASTE